jgi:hypothetical protein
MATDERPTVVGVFADRERAARAVAELESSGFTPQQVGFIVPREEQFEGNTGVGDSDTAVEAETSRGAATGAVVGGLIGAAAALLIPGLGPVAAGGILAAALTGAGVGAVTGGLVGALTNLGLSEAEASQYEREFRAGRALVTVRADGRQAAARDILRRHGATGLDSAGTTTII